MLHLTLNFYNITHPEQHEVAAVGESDVEETGFAVRS